VSNRCSCGKFANVLEGEKHECVDCYLKHNKKHIS
jgi:hypothetical protein